MLLHSGSSPLDHRWSICYLCWHFQTHSLIRSNAPVLQCLRPHCPCRSYSPMYQILLARGTELTHNSNSIRKPWVTPYQTAQESSACSLRNTGCPYIASYCSSQCRLLELNKSISAPPLPYSLSATSQSCHHHHHISTKSQASWSTQVWEISGFSSASSCDPYWFGPRCYCFPVPSDSCRVYAQKTIILNGWPGSLWCLKREGAVPLI